MKKMMCIAAIITSVMLLMPLAVLGKTEEQENIIATLAPITKPQPNKTMSFRVLDKESGKITEMSADEYIFGVVAAEMPALYDVEALKAQAVASYTYACYKKDQNGKEDYDITTDFTTDQSFKTETQAIKDWGEKADEYVKKIKEAIKAVSGQTLCYENKPILAVYHAVSSGETYSAKDVWGKEISYLQSVPSEGDKLASNYTAVLEFSEDKISSIAKEKEDDSPCLSSLKSKSNGLVETVKLYGKEITGSELRSALELPSTNFKFEKKDGKYIFTCLGYGHGVGMSQKGADYLAKQGYTYKQILNHFYKGVKIVEVK